MENKSNKNYILDYLSSFPTNYYINDIYEIIQLNRDIIYKHNFFSCIYIYILFFFFMIISWFSLLINLPFKVFYNCNYPFALCRVRRVQEKILKLKLKIHIYSDDIKNMDYTMYRIGSYKERAKFMILKYFKFCWKDFKELNIILNNSKIKIYKYKVLSILVKRIPHSIIYFNSVNCILKNYNIEYFYTGQMCDRFALLELKLANIYGKNLICIPHGVESTDKKPAGFTGTTFYTTSLSMAIYLNELYNSSKFVFDDKIISTIYFINTNKEVDCHKKTIFFTQAYDDFHIKEILLNIALYLEKFNQKLYIKVHPLDHEKNYRNIENIEFLNNYETAICNNICISIDSTALLEALYNNSLSISILPILKNFPSNQSGFLNNENIIKIHELNELFNIIKIEIK